MRLTPQQVAELEKEDSYKKIAEKLNVSEDDLREAHLDYLICPKNVHSSLN